MAAINGPAMAQPGRRTISGDHHGRQRPHKGWGRHACPVQFRRPFQGQSRLYVQSANNYSGGTTINAGNLQMGNANGSALGTGALTLNGGTLSVQTGTVSIQGGVLNVNTAQQAMLNDLEQQAGRSRSQDQTEGGGLAGEDNVERRRGGPDRRPVPR